MTWGALLSAMVGAIIALGGTLLADTRRDSQQRGRDLRQDRRKQCVDFVIALGEALGGLRGAALVRDDGERRAAAAEAMTPVYPAREQLLVTATAAELLAGETAFHRLVAVRDAVRAGATLASAEYHDAYHPLAEALWGFRLTIRADLGQPKLAPDLLGRPDWTDRDRCDVCQARAA
ncbi:hypothetical protein [Dactylosporangium sp. CA-092794]|uniref:hypothetical protein n=1 Tax=Dactylosporangium sp. CA-092794 TaxID=3239929 RepID=UPI003D8D7416